MVVYDGNLQCCDFDQQNAKIFILLVGEIKMRQILRNIVTTIKRNKIRSTVFDNQHTAAKENYWPRDFILQGTSPNTCVNAERLGNQTLVQQTGKMGQVYHCYMLIPISQTDVND